ncbi:glucan endo-1,3-beta-glucosidase 10-like [Musa acuminata AAA Group]|uniref:glucan endo-1,3-beta-glucosidase 10-like n=1 Tax=Musa acuminata AAA Group TaxID=214697 RepID=UPI0031D079AC
MDDLHDTLTSLGLNRDIVVLSSPHRPTNPPTSLPPGPPPLHLPLLAFHADTGSPFFVNAYPYFVYAKDPFDVTLEDTLLDLVSVAFTDPAADLSYANRAIAVVASPSLKGDRTGVQESETGPGERSTIQWQADSTGGNAEGDVVLGLHLRPLQREPKGRAVLRAQLRPLQV